MIPLKNADKLSTKTTLEAFREYDIIQCTDRDTAFDRKCTSDAIAAEKLESALRNQKLESLGLLVGGVAHDFNNLLCGIFGYIELAKEVSTERNVKQYLAKAIQAIDRTRGLTCQLLAFAKDDAPARKVLSLIPLIREASEFALSGSNVSCHYNLAHDLWPCLIDKNQLCQVIDNIVINARQAMPAGGIIEITAQNKPGGDWEKSTTGNYVKVSIKDHGIGMSKTIFSKIFTPLFTTKQKGHGLGLATCQSIVKRHGGSITVESVLGEGTTFHISLPASTNLERLRKRLIFPNQRT
jgi:signal transduction histidine kinase